MTVQEYLSQAYRIDKRINAKLEQICSLRELATKATATLSDDRVQSSSNPHKMSDIIDKMVDLENEINKDIDHLVSLKGEIMTLIKGVSDTGCQTLLELRYLCYKKWEQVAVELGYSIQHTHRIHDKALKIISENFKDEMKCD
jgi:DNA-directed RNA polymerase specialized sigma subunit